MAHADQHDQNDTLARLAEANARLAAARAYVDDPGNWSTFDGRRSVILGLLDGTISGTESDRG